jgi:hypothetical protein
VVVRSAGIWLGSIFDCRSICCSFKTELLHKIKDGHYKDLRVVPFRKMILRIGETVKFLISIIMWAMRRPLTVAAGKILVKTAAESCTSSFSDVVRLYEGFIVSKAIVLLDMRLRTRCNICTARAIWYEPVTRIGRRCRWRGIRYTLGGYLPPEFFIFCLDLPQVAN